MLSTSLIIRITLFKSQIVLAEHECSTNWGEYKSKIGKPEHPEKKPLGAELRTNKLDLCFSHKSKRGLKNSVHPVQTSNSVSKRYLTVECGELIIVMSKIWKNSPKVSRNG